MLDQYRTELLFKEKDKSRILSILGLIQEPYLHDEEMKRRLITNLFISMNELLLRKTSHIMPLLLKSPLFDKRYKREILFSLDLIPNKEYHLKRVSLKTLIQNVKQAIKEQEV